MADINELILRARQIRDETGIEANSATRVGQLLEDMAAAALTLGPNDRPDLLKSVRCYDETTPQYYAGSSIVADVPEAGMCLQTILKVEFGPDGPGREYRVVYASNGPLLVYLDAGFRGVRDIPARLELVEVTAATAYTDAQAQAAVAAGLDGGSETIGVGYDPADTVSPLFLFLRSLSVKLVHLASEVRDLLLTPDQKAAIPAGASATNKLALRSDIPAASTTSGNLYASTGQNTDGPMTQQATTNALAGKADAVLSMQATVAITAGQLVRLANGATGAVVLYDAEVAAEAGQLLGVALAAAAAGQPVPVQTSGIITLPGWNLTPGFCWAGPDGTVTPPTNRAGLGFLHVIGRAQTPDTLLLHTFSLLGL